ncbi:MAG: hypothetical protein Q4B91_00225 [Atopobiaceae bacterium]|nr:hypothetical protein [Atopobiaceae bacterium]
MSAFRLTRPDESQVDPFNAGEPELPGAEPDLPGAAPEGLGAEGPDYAPHGEPGGQPHKPDDNYQAPTTRGHAYDAPSTDEPPAPRRRARRGRPKHPERPVSAGRGGGQQLGKLIEAIAARGNGQRLGKKLIEAIIAFIIVVNVVVPTLMLVGEFVEDDFSSADGVSYLTHGDDDADEGAIELAASAALSGALADPESGALHDLVAEYLDEKLLTIEGYSAEQLGIDADAFATWAVSQTSFSTDGGYDWGDGTANAYVDIVAPNVNDIFWAANVGLSHYLMENDLLGVFSEDGASLSEDQRAAAAALFQDAVDAADAGEPLSYSLELTLEDGTWVVDAGSLSNLFVSAYSLW